MVAIAFGLMAIATGAAVGEATSSNSSLALATNVDSGLDAPRQALAPPQQRNPASRFSIEVLEAPLRDPGFGFEAAHSSGTPTSGMEVQLSTSTPLNLDVGVARRQVSAQGSSQFTEGGGSEVRLGQNLARLAPAFTNPSAGETVWYMFAASDGKALTWNPSSDPSDANRNFRLQDRAEIGDVQAGLTMQRGGMQASLAMVQRTVKTQVGPYKKSRDESFAGLTFTWKR